MISRILICIIVIYPLLFIWQGIGFGDEGFALASYQQIFDEPESIAGGFVFNWLQNLAGGIWMSLLGDSMGLLGIRFGLVLVQYITVVVCYLTLRPYIRREYLLAGLFFAIILNTPLHLHYHHLSALFFVISVFFLTRGLKYAKSQLICISGFTLGLSLFVRFPNILGLTFLLGIFFYGRLNKTLIKIQIRQTVIYILGYVVAILVAVLAMRILDHHTLFMNNLRTMFGFGAAKTSHHSVVKLMAVLVMDHLMVAFLFVSGILSVFIVAKAISWLNDRYSRYTLTLTLGIVFSLVLIYAAPVIGKLTPRYYQYVPSSVPTLLTIGVLYAVLLKYMFGVGGNSDLRLISLFALMVLLLTPIGSNSGIKTVKYGVWLASPMAIMAILELRHMKIAIEAMTESSSAGSLAVGLSEKEVVLARKPMVASFIIFSFILCAGLINRIEMRYSIEHPRLNGIFTTRQTTRVLQEALGELDNHVRDGDYLLAYNNIPILHFLTKTKPYLYNPWPMEIYGSEELERLLGVAVTEKRCLPIVVRGRGREIVPDTDSGKRISTMQRIMGEFLDHNQYSVIWRNDAFDILMPSSYRG